MGVQALKDWKGEELDDLSFNKDDIITVKKEDGAGWASGNLPDGTSGWFPLDCASLVHENAVADVGTATGACALDAFIEEAKKKPAVHLNIEKLQTSKKNVSLDNFLASKPMKEQTLDEGVFKSEETIDELEAAHRRLV